MRRYLALALSFLIVFGCSTYSGRPVIVPKIETMPVSRTEGSVTVGVDPYIQPDRQKEVFDDDLEKVGVLPIYVLIKNKSDRSLSLRHADTKLELPDGHQISPVDTEKVLQVLRRMPPVSGRGSKQDLAIAILLSPVLFPLIPFAVAGAEAHKKATNARMADYLDKEFGALALSVDGLAHGFIYLMPPSSGLEALKGKLVLRFVDETDGTSFVVRVPLQ